jgi:hypothetical protein
MAFTLRYDSPANKSLAARDAIVQRFNISIPLGPGLPQP